jgi:hypothetical protein
MELFVRAGLGEALDIFRKWAAESASLRCEGEFESFAFSMRVRPLSVQDSEIRFMSLDANGELVIRLVDTMYIGFLDAEREHQDDEYGDCLVVLLTDPDAHPDPDALTFVAIRV